MTLKQLEQCMSCPRMNFKVIIDIDNPPHISAFLKIHFVFISKLVFEKCVVWFWLLKELEIA